MRKVMMAAVMVATVVAAGQSASAACVAWRGPHVAVGGCGPVVRGPVIYPRAYVYPGFYYPAPAYPPPETIVYAAPPSWYWCDNPRGYYPAVAACPGGWRAVPAR